MERKLIFMDANSSKFWNIVLEGNSHTVNYGRTGTDGQTKTKEFDDAQKAQASFEKLVKQKIGKGYVDAGSTGGTVTEPEITCPQSRSIRCSNKPISPIM